MYDNILAKNKTEGAALLDQMVRKNPMFSCVIDVTQKAKIQGISGAEENPEINDYTPPSDVDLFRLRK